MKNILGLLLLPIIVPTFLIYLLVVFLYQFGGEAFEALETVLYNIGFRK